MTGSAEIALLEEHSIIGSVHKAVHILRGNDSWTARTCFDKA